MSINFDRIAARYDETRGGEERGAEIAGVIAPCLPSDGRVLEIGVGTGLVGRAIGRDIVGIDISEAMLAVARQRLEVLARADATALPFAADSFAGMYAVWVFHLVPDHHALLAEARRVLRPGTPFVIETAPIFSAEGNPVQAILGPLYASLKGPHGTADQITSVAETVGFQVVEVATRSSTFEQAPSEVADGIESKAGAAFWELSPETWTSLVEPAIAAIRALPDHDVPRLRKQVHTTVVLTAT